LISDYDKRYPKDEDHCWTGISIEDAENCWVRLVNFKHFAGSAVIVQRTGSKITVEDCISKEPVSEIGGMRRCTFNTLWTNKLYFNAAIRNRVFMTLLPDIAQPVPMLLYNVIRMNLWDSAVLLMLGRADCCLT
jgi:hypothetical protein